MAATKKLKTNRYWTDQETGQVYRLYRVRLYRDDGTTKDFPSQEHANAYLEDRDPDWKFGME